VNTIKEILCGSRKYLNPHHRGSLEIPRRRGDLKAKIFKGKYEPKLEFPEEWGVQTKKIPPRGEYGYFLKQHITLHNFWVCVSLCMDH